LDLATTIHFTCQAAALSLWCCCATAFSSASLGLLLFYTLKPSLSHRLGLSPSRVSVSYVLLCLHGSEVNLLWLNIRIEKRSHTQSHPSTAAKTHYALAQLTTPTAC
jgi:hypothetical protein